MKITSAKVRTGMGAHEAVDVWIDGKLSGSLVVGEGEGSKLIIELLGGPSWLIKDFNVLYRTALAFSEACRGRGDARPYQPHLDLQAQLERLRQAYDLTEHVRASMREGG